MWAATVSDDGDPETTVTAEVVEENDEAWLVVDGLAGGGAVRVTATVTASRADSFSGDATVSGRSILCVSGAKV